MANQQTKKRRKRYQPGSAYAGDVKPTGVFRVFGNVKLFFIVGAVIMLGSVLAGGILSFNNDPAGTPPQFVRPGEDDGTPGASDDDGPAEVRQFEAAPPLTLDTSKSYTATIRTSAGEIQVELFDDQAPQTVNNFVFLAENDFYDGLIFHQVVNNFNAQAGDPFCQASGETSCRGSGDPGYSLDQEAPGEFAIGTLGMANASQFFIALDDSEQFNEFTPFGRVTSGLDVAQSLARGTEIESVEISSS
jgi:cyclophilin family peptidyl-prolyl cis-trans isomerase